MYCLYWFIFMLATYEHHVSTWSSRFFYFYIFEKTPFRTWISNTDQFANQTGQSNRYFFVMHTFFI